MKNKLASIILALALVAGAFAQATGIPPTPPALPGDAIKPAELAAVKDELNATKASLEQTRTVAQQQIDILTVRAERGEYAYRAERLNQENLALRNALAQAEARVKELQTNATDTQARYDMEKAKVEALLKKHPSDAAVVAKIETPPAPATAPPAK